MQGFLSVGHGAGLWGSVMRGTGPVMCDNGEPRRRPGTGQGIRRIAALFVLAGALVACSDLERFSDSKLSIDTPIDWWHDLQGGKIAEVRPPPPGVGDPYPNLGQVPPAPTPTDGVTRRALAARLSAERDRTRREATQDPLILPVPPAAKPAVAPPRPPDPNASTMVLEAATAPPPAPTPPPTPTPKAPPVAAAAPALDMTPPPAPRPAVESGPIPDLPTAAPPLPRIAGLPASATAPPVPRVPPPVLVAFPPGSAALPAEADAALRGLAGRRAGGPIGLAAGGDAGASGPEAQARALPLALRRVRAMQDVLLAAGVPPGAMRVDAAAMGRGGAARLIQ